MKVDRISLVKSYTSRTSRLSTYNTSHIFDSHYKTSESRLSSLEMYGNVRSCSLSDLDWISAKIRMRSLIDKITTEISELSSYRSADEEFCLDDLIDYDNHARIEVK